MQETAGSKTTAGDTAKPLKRGTACLRCRKSKLRCDGTQPTCTRCSSGGGSAECVYDKVYRRRSVRGVDRQIGNPDLWNPENLDFDFKDFQRGITYQGISEGLDSVPNFSRIPAEAGPAGFDQGDGHQPSQVPGQMLVDTDPVTVSSNLDFTLSVASQPSEVIGPVVPLSPNTQALFRDFVGMSTPVFEKTYQFTSPEPGKAAISTYDATSQDAGSVPEVSPVSAGLMTGNTEIVRAHSNPVATDTDPLWSGFFPSPSAFFMPSGFNLWNMSGFNQQASPWNTPQAFVPSFADTAVDGFSLIQDASVSSNLAVSTQQEFANLTSSAPASSSGSSSNKSIPTFENTSFPRSETLLNKNDPKSMPRESRKLIDAPPFLRQKLLRSYCYNIKRFATLHMDRLKFRERLSQGLESGLHPAFVFSMYTIGAAWHDEPAIRDCQTNFYDMAKTEFYRGMSEGNHCLDLIRAAMDLMIYLLAQGRKNEAVIFGNQAAMLARFSGLHLSDYSPQHSVLRRRYLFNGYATNDEERVERMHLFWSVWTMDCCTILVWQRLSAFDDQTDFPLVVNESSRCTTLQDFLEGTDIGLEHMQEPAGTPLILALALTTYAFELSFLPPSLIGDKGSLAETGIERMKMSMPVSWKEFAKYSSCYSDVSAVPEKFILMCIWSLLELAQAYLYRLNGPASIGQVVLCARRIVNYIGILQNDEDFTRIPMHAQIFWSHAINLLSDEAQRLREIGSIVDAQQIEIDISIANRALTKHHRAYVSRGPKQ